MRLCRIREAPISLGQQSEYDEIFLSFSVMDNVKFEKMYAELVARGINPREFADWLRRFDQCHPYKKAVSSLEPLAKMRFVYEDTESKDFLADDCLCGLRLAKHFVLSTSMRLCGCGIEESKAFARKEKKVLLDYDELMLTASLLPEVNKVLAAANLREIPITRAFWCRKKRQTVLIDLCNGRYSATDPENGGVLLKIV